MFINKPSRGISKLRVSLEVKLFSSTNMASDENVRECNFQNNFGTHSENEWEPLALTTVEYPKGDIVGKFLALSSLLPFGIISGFAALILFRRDLHTIFFFMGTMCNEVMNFTLKQIIREARPKSRATLYTEYGMPSAHSQFMWFFTTYIILFIYIRLQHMNNKTTLETVCRACLTVAVVSASLIVSYSRIYLMYHTWSQVLCGAAVGAIDAALWFTLTYIVFTPFFPIIVSWKLSEFLLLRDTTLIPNVLWFEYTNSRQEARARARKLASMKSQ